MKARSSSPRPLAISLARLTSCAAIAAALHLATAPPARAAEIIWDGEGGDFFWLNPLNWAGNVLPDVFDDARFGTSAPGVIHLGGDQSVGGLSFTSNFTLGAYGTNHLLNIGTGAVTVNNGVFATINASYDGFAGLDLTGGGTLYLNHPRPTFGGGISVSGAGTTLLVKLDTVYPQNNGVNSTQLFGRGDTLPLGYNTSVRNITLFDGGEFKMVGPGNNPELNHKNITIGAGGGAINVAAGYQLLNLDDLGQLANTPGATFTKRGTGRMVITGTMADNNVLTGDIVIDRGIFDLSRLQGAGGAGTRFAGVTGTTGAALGTNSLTINSGGVLVLNNGTQGMLDVASVVANDGAILAVQGQDHEFGARTNDDGLVPANTLTINGTVTLLTRDLFSVQTQRFPRIHSALVGSGTLDLFGSTNAGGVPRLVIQRSTAASTFTGTFRLNENVSLEAHPRFSTEGANIGKMIAGGDIEFAGWGGTLDIRDSDPATKVMDYSDNEITVTTGQLGALNIIAPIRATAANGTGHLFNFGTLTMGNHRIAIQGNNNYQTGFADTASITGAATIYLRSAGSHLVFSNPAAITEDAAGRSLTFIKTGVGNTAAQDVISGGAINVSRVEVNTGTLQLRGADGAIGTGFGGDAPLVIVNGGDFAANQRGLPTQGILHLDSNASHIVGGTTVIAGANSNNRIADNALVTLNSNSTLRLTSAPNTGTTETFAHLMITGHGLLDVVKTGVSPTPVALTISNSMPHVAHATANFTGTGLGAAGGDSSRIILPATSTGILPAWIHSGNEFARYDATVDSGFALGVTPFTNADYILNTTQDTWTAGQIVKLNTGAGDALTDNRTVGRLNFQFTAANQAINTNGFTLSIADQGLITSANTSGIVGNAGVGGLTAGTTGPASLSVHSNATLEIHVPVVNNADGGPVTFVKSGTGTVVLSHHSRTVGQGQLASAPFTTDTWSSTHTGAWVINDGALQVHRGQFLGGQTVILAGGTLEINQPVSTVNAHSILGGWGNNILVIGNAMLGSDDNGESNDANVGGNTLTKLGSLTINNGATLGMGSWNNLDYVFNGATFNTRGTLNIGTNRGGVNSAKILSGVVAGNGFDVVAYGATPETLIIGGTQLDQVHNTYDGPVVVYGGTVRLNKANGFNAITDGAGAEDLVINGGSVFWGPGHHGDLTTTNNPALTNNNVLGITPLSPAPIRNAGTNQIADTATVTLLAGTLGESDRITNEVFGTLNQRNGTVNVGLGMLEVGVANISGGAMGFDRGGTFKAGRLNMLPGAYNLNIFTGLPFPGGETRTEIGAGGMSLTGQSIFLGGGFSANMAGSGGVLKLGGDVSVSGTPLIGNSYNTGIYIQTGNSFREIGNSHVDLAGGNRAFDIDPDVQFYVTAPIVNGGSATFAPGGLIKNGGGALILQPYQPSSFSGPIVVNAGVLAARSDGAFGSQASGVTINNGGTVKLEGHWGSANAFTVTGPGAVVPGDSSVREVGALVSDSGINIIVGALALGGDATIASNIVYDPSVTPGSGGAPAKISLFRIESAGGITGAGNLTLSGHGEGIVLNGLNMTGGLEKTGAGRWTIGGASSFAGPARITAGSLRITHSAALGGTAGGTTVLGGALELAGGISSAERLTLNGFGSGVQDGALTNISGSNTLSGPVTLGSGTRIHSTAGTLALGSTITGSGSPLVLSGAGNGSVAGAITLGTVAGDALIKNGSGTWTLNGTNTFNGGTRINGGSLILGGAGTSLHSGSPLTLAGGSLVLTGAAQTVNGLTVTGGGSSINGGAGLNVGEITREQGGSVNFTGSVRAAGSVNTDGILGGYATVGGTDWATLNGSSQVVAFTDYAPLATESDFNTANSILTTARVQNGDVATNSLKIAGGSGLVLGFNSLTLASGGLLHTSASRGAIIGTGTLSGPSSFDDLIIHTAGGVLETGVPLIGSGGGLTKTGPGTLILSGASSFSGPIHINEGTISILGPGGTTHPTTLGSSAGPRPIELNGGTFQVVGLTYDPGSTNIRFVIGSGGGTLRTVLGSTLIINDSGTPGQLSGSGDLTYTGGGRFTMSGGTPTFPNFTGKVTLDGGVLTLGNNNNTTTNVLGGRAEQTITVKAGSVLINNAGFGLGANGLPNNLVIEGGAAIHALSANRVFSGNVELSGTNTIALLERDNVGQDRQIHFNGRVTGSGITLNVVGTNFGSPFYLSGGSNEITGAINLFTNAVLEARTPGSVGKIPGDVTVNMLGATSRLLLRHYQNADYRANVVVRENAELSADRLVNFGGGTSQLLSINNLTVDAPANSILTVAGGNAYTVRVADAANIASNTIFNATNNILFENGLAFSAGANALDKRGGGSIILRGAANHTGRTFLQGGFLVLRGVGGTLPNTSSIELRGGELRVENSDALNANRINDAAPIVLGGGVLRLSGEAAIGNVTAVAGTTQVINNPTSETIAMPLTLNGFSRALGAVVQFQSPDFGGAVGSASLGQARVSSRILIPGQANVTGTQVIPGFFANNTLDFIQYDGTTIDNGVPLGIREMRNPGSTISPANYTNDLAEGSWTDNVILRTGAANTTINLTANRALEAWKIEAQTTTVNIGSNILRIENGGIILAGNNTTNFNSDVTGGLTAGPAVPGTDTAELFFAGNNATANPLTINARIVNNDTQPVAVVKTGTGFLVLNGANNYTGGTFLNTGTTRVTANTALGAASNPLHLGGGTLDLFLGTGATEGPIGGFGQNINVTSNSVIIFDNGPNAASLDNDYAFGGITIDGPYTLGLRGFDSMDAVFTGTHTFAGMPTIDLPQAGSGSNPNTAATASVMTLSGPITGSGFYISSSANTNDTAARLQIGDGDATPNTYTGPVILLPGSNNEDLFVELNKAAGVTAITGDLRLDGGTVLLNASNQIADASNVTLNRGVLNFNGSSETVASVKMNGGGLITNPTTAGATPPANVVTITGDVEVNGISNFAGVTTGFTVGNNSTVNIGGALRIGTYGRVHLSEGASGGFLNIAGPLEMTGALLQQSNGAGPNTVRLGSDVTTFAATVPSLLGNSDDSDTFLELNGTRTFTVADGPAGLDLSVSSVIRNSNSPSAVGGMIKAGPGVMQLQGGGTANSYTGPTTINEGALMLWKSTNVNALGQGPITVGDGIGGERADQLILRNSNQIPDGATLTIASSGLLDMDTFNTSETIAGITGSGAVDLGPGSVLTLNAISGTNTFSGSIRGGGGLTKAGDSILELLGASDYLGPTNVDGGTLLVSGSIAGSPVTVNSNGTLSGSGVLGGSVSALPGAIVDPAGELGTGDLNLQFGSTLKIELASAAIYDRLNVTGAVSLDGDLDLTVNFAPAFTDVFAIILNNGSDPVTGTFTGLPEGSSVGFFGGREMFITYQGNGDGHFVGNDVLLVIPEPGSAALALFGLLPLGLRRFRRRQ